MFDSTLLKIANTLTTYCSEGKEAKGLNELYAVDAVSVEAADMGGTGAEAKGLDAIRGKHEWWFGAHEVHGGEIEGPFLHGSDRFGLIFDIDATNKETGQRMQGRELGLYTVKSGKIVREEFFYLA